MMSGVNMLQNWNAQNNDGKLVYYCMKKVFFTIVSLMFILWGWFYLATRQKPPEAIVIQAPVSVTTKIEENDSSNLVITVENKSYKVTLRNRSFATDKLDALKNFLEENKTLVDKEKVMVFKKNDNNNMDSNFINVLLKMNITRFKMVTN